MSISSRKIKFGEQVQQICMLLFPNLQLSETNMVLHMALKVDHMVPVKSKDMAALAFPKMVLWGLLILCIG